MKISNTPARKEARRQAAAQRESGVKGVTAREVYDGMINYDVVRAVRTKKVRTSKRF